MVEFFECEKACVPWNYASTIWFSYFQQFFGFLMVLSVFFFFCEGEFKLDVNQQSIQTDWEHPDR